MEHVAEVLIVDDEEYNRVVLVGLAKELGYVPLQADNARAAVEIVRTHAVDLVFLDLELSGAKGDDAARALRKLPGGHGPLLIATTGHDSEEARQRCRTAGIDGFLLKPFDSQQVREVIRLARAARTGAAAASIAVSASARGTVEEPRPVLRAFQLYAQGANESADEAARRFVFALRHEIAAIRAGSNADARIAITSAAHRLRTLGALVHAQRVSDAAVLLQNRASVAAPAQLGELVENAVRETEQLITMLREAGVVVDAPGSP
jgi:CheY-like chemotaxis protein